MLVLFEGMDLTGKTTLAKAVASMGMLDYFHRGPPGDAPALEHHLAFAEAYDRSAYGIVIDRNHLSSVAYSVTYDHPDNPNDPANFLGPDEFAEVEDAMLERGGIMVYCERDLGAIKAEMLAGREEDHPEVPGLYQYADAIVDRFGAALRMSRLPVFRHDWEGGNERSPERILAKARERSTK